MVRRGVWHKWEPPAVGTYKLNTDGSAKDEMCTGGGIICNSEGGIIASFSAFFGRGTNNYAEIFAVAVGLRLCHSLGIGAVVVETDSLLTVNAIKNLGVAWDLEYVYRICMQEVRPYHKITHVVRQENTVADRLANWAYTHKSYQEFFSGNSMPQEAKAAYISDKLGIANFRK
ncbi:PREDICTED: uncharacterized protein LOC105967794 [Erythranthe guttata]|uniref:uncharacterized protein LOC105967794 n=1 Tax=Erythranthe guttata TaxID=4155 RepID=UPI00064E0735|nr:PREDICTED: uncharacterized protein LOC105967794 [Erythranthe guttata]|eukprot:XP_012847860.1 PREDICTED: uncharacterized protein LOC105967794 [Erythranthe guttata]